MDFYADLHQKCPRCSQKQHQFLMQNFPKTKCGQNFPCCFPCLQNWKKNKPKEEHCKIKSHFFKIQMMENLKKKIDFLLTKAIL